MRFGLSEGKGIDIPVLNQDSVFHTDNVCRNHRQPDPREPAVDDDELSLRYDYSGLILERGRGALDQVEETVTARLNVRAVLNVVGRPEALRCRIISLIKQGLKASSTIALLFCAFESFIVISAFPTKLLVVNSRGVSEEGCYAGGCTVKSLNSITNAPSSDPGLLPDDVGPMIAALLSDENRWVNVQRIEVRAE
jgi:hypothetical protein